MDINVIFTAFFQVFTTGYLYAFLGACLVGFIFAILLDRFS